MFLNYYKLAEQPFGVTPDSRFLYLGPQHREALASLVYGTESDRGFLAMIAEPGMGKTSLLYQYLSQMRDKVRTAFVFRTDCDSREFVKHVLLDFGIDVAGMDLPAMHEKLNRLVIDETQAGRRVVLVVDEAQNLDEKTLESIRLLSNFETPWKKLMLIVLAGQPQLADKLDSPSLSQLRQRISMVIRIEPFTHEEVNAYIDHRLWVAGEGKPALFTVGARKLIAEHSRGIPRTINNICFNAMSLGCALRKETIDRDIVSEVISDLDLAPLKSRPEVPAVAVPASRLKSEVVAESDPAPQGNVRKAVEERFLTVAKSEAQEPDRQPNVVPARFYTSKASDRSLGWVLRLAVAAMLFLAVVGSAGQIQRVESQVSVLPASPVVPISTPLISTRVADTAERSIPKTSYFVRVVPGETLYHICIAKFGKYDERMFEKLRLLNPWMSDPNLLESGRELFVPLSISDPGDMKHTADAGGSVERAASE
jgi:type II secretory pathway predicted ATPase ExeA